MIAREDKLKKLVKKYSAKIKSLLEEFNAAKDPMERLEIHRKIQAFQETQHLTERGIDAGLQGSQEVFIEILVYVEIN